MDSFAADCSCTSYSCYAADAHMCHSGASCDVDAPQGARNGDPPDFFRGTASPGLTKGGSLTLISSFLIVPLWMISAWLAETVGTRQGAGATARRDIETSYDAHQRSKHLGGATDASLPKPRKSKRRYKVAGELRLGIMLIAMMALLWLLVLR